MVKIIQRARGSALALFIIIGLIISIPGIIMLSISSTIYGQPIQETGQIFNTDIGYNNTLTLSNLMIQGNNYDIRIDVSVDAIPANPADSEITLRMTTQKTGTDLSTLPASHDFHAENFNSTVITEEYEFKDDFEFNTDANFTFEVVNSENLTNIYIKIYLYENPRRVLASIASTLGLILLIPGALILIGVACMVGGGKRN